MCISTRALRTALQAFIAEHFKPASRTAPFGDGADRAADLDVLLNRLFSPKQKELVFKKLDGKAFTKTEREYYSRTVRKKLEAIANEQVNELARKLVSK